MFFDGHHKYTSMCVSVSVILLAIVIFHFRLRKNYSADQTTNIFSDFSFYSSQFYMLVTWIFIEFHRLLVSCKFGCTKRATPKTYFFIFLRPLLLGITHSTASHFTIFARVARNSIFSIHLVDERTKNDCRAYSHEKRETGHTAWAGQLAYTSNISIPISFTLFLLLFTRVFQTHK